jgi:hypothetical protein
MEAATDAATLVHIVVAALSWRSIHLCLAHRQCLRVDTLLCSAATHPPLQRCRPPPPRRCAPPTVADPLHVNFVSRKKRLEVEIFVRKIVRSIKFRKEQWIVHRKK